MITRLRLLAMGLLALALGACAVPWMGLHAISTTGNVIGVSDKTIIAALGEPQFKRKDPPTEIWQYTSRACVLLLFLYPARAGADGTGKNKVSNGGAVVRHFAAQSRKGRNYPPNECVKRIFDDHDRGAPTN